jgi:phosphate-selective porin OprO/OprP
VHLGLSYLHRFRNDDEGDPTTEFRTRPESRLTDDRLVDTSLISDQGQNLVSLEVAWMNGPLSIQGEYFHDRVDSESTLNFCGWYLQGSWFLTGESKKHQTSAGVFAGISPQKEFRLGENGWGALELALRFSKVDLNDKYVRGGEERNITVGLNWYLRRKVRIMINYIYTYVEDRADPFINNGRADLIMSRFQINF